MSLRALMRNLTAKVWKARETAILIARNLWSSKPVAGGNGPVVSLTSYGTRAHSVYLTIESIGRGSLRPARLILWLDEDGLLRHLPRALRRLQRRGLEVLPCEDLGPHKKYYPYISSYIDDEAVLVTADDDIIYPGDWLAGLAKASSREPSTVLCYRARTISLAGGESLALAPYSRWGLRRSTTAGPQVFPTGTSGVLYPPAVQRAILAAGRGADTELRMVDDVWLHSTVIRAGFSARQITSEAVHFPMLFLSQRDALFRNNVFANGNDAVVARAYPADLTRLIAEGLAAEPEVAA